MNIEGHGDPNRHDFPARGPADHRQVLVAWDDTADNHSTNSLRQVGEGRGHPLESGNKKGDGG